MDKEEFETLIQPYVKEKHVDQDSQEVKFELINFKREMYRKGSEQKLTKSLNERKSMGREQKNEKLMKAIKTPDGIFKSSKEAGKHYGITGAGIMGRLAKSRREGDGKYEYV